MIELLVVVGLIVVMAAVGLPNLIGYMRQAKVRGAMQQVAGEMQTARNKADRQEHEPGCRVRGARRATPTASSCRTMPGRPPTWGRSSSCRRA